MNAQLKKNQCEFMILIKYIFQTPLIKWPNSKNTLLLRNNQSNTQIWVSSITLHFKKLEKAERFWKILLFSKIKDNFKYVWVEQIVIKW